MILSRLSKNIVGISLLLILYFTLFPFDFSFNETLSPGEIFRNFDLNISQTYALEDFPRNMVLFMPLGFGLAGLLSGRKARKIGGYLLIVLGGVGLSLIVEVLQSYTLQRFPSFGDVAANGSGTAAGLLIFHCIGKYKTERDHPWSPLAGWEARAPRLRRRRFFIGKEMLKYTLLALLLKKVSKLEGFPPLNARVTTRECE